MEIYEFFGYLGGLILTLCLVPQIMKTYKTKKADDISTVWEYLYFIGVTFYIIYAIDKDLPPVYIPAFLELIFIGILFYLKRTMARAEHGWKIHIPVAGLMFQTMSTRIHLCKSMIGLTITPLKMFY